MKYTAILKQEGDGGLAGFRTFLVLIAKNVPERSCWKVLRKHSLRLLVVISA